MMNERQVTRQPLSPEAVLPGTRTGRMTCPLTEAAMNTSLLTNAKTWMIVDDNEHLLMAMSAVLANLTSADIECHSSPQSALAAFAAAPEKYALVITDYEMPYMDGVALCGHIHALAPHQTVFLATGSGVFTEAAARHAGFSALLNKPFPLAFLRQALRENLPETADLMTA